MSLTKISKLSDIKDTSKLSVLKFYAEWCGPCKMLGPVLSQVASEINDVDFYEIDIDDEAAEDLVKKFAINSVPTVIFLKNNEKVSEFLGFKPAEQIILEINKNK